MRNITRRYLAQNQAAVARVVKAGQAIEAAGIDMYAPEFVRKYGHMTPVAFVRDVLEAPAPTVRIHVPPRQIGETRPRGRRSRSGRRARAPARDDDPPEPDPLVVIDPSAFRAEVDRLLGGIA